QWWGDGLEEHVAVHRRDLEHRRPWPVVNLIEFTCRISAAPFELPGYPGVCFRAPVGISPVGHSMRGSGELLADDLADGLALRLPRHAGHHVGHHAADVAQRRGSDLGDDVVHDLVEL